jgi:hypothetical protein
LQTVRAPWFSRRHQLDDVLSLQGRRSLVAVLPTEAIDDATVICAPRLVNVAPPDEPGIFNFVINKNWLLFFGQPFPFLDNLSPSPPSEKATAHQDQARQSRTGDGGRNRSRRNGHLNETNSAMPMVTTITSAGTRSISIAHNDRASFLSIDTHLDRDGFPVHRLIADTQWTIDEMS